MTINYSIGTPRKDGRMRISLILNIGKTKKRIHTDIIVSKSDINRQGKLKNDSPAYNKVKNAIAKKEREFGSLETFLSGEKLSANDAYAKMTKTDVPTFFTYTERWLLRADMKGKKNYKSAINSFKAFLKGNDIAFDMFSHMLLEDYKYSLKDKPRAQSLYLNAIKRIYDDAEKDYDIKPFSKMRFDIPRQNISQHRALSKETLLKIFNYNGNTRRAMLARDCAIISFCLCGTNAIDLYNAPSVRNNIFRYNRTKTKDRRADDAYMEITIHDIIKPLMKKYKGATHALCFYQDYATPVNFNNALNKGLKAITDEIGIKDKVTFYSIRHTFATIARNEVKIDKSLVHEMLCHRERETAIDDIYIKKDFKLINEANQKVIDYIFNGQ